MRFSESAGGGFRLSLSDRMYRFEFPPRIRLGKVPPFEGWVNPAAQGRCNSPLGYLFTHMRNACVLEMSGGMNATRGPQTMYKGGW